MTAAGCPSPPCPVVDLDDVDLRRCRTTTWDQATFRWRAGARAWPLEGLNPSKGQVSRFAPLDDRAHACVAAKQTVALLESAFHGVAADPDSRFIYPGHDLAGREVGGVTTTRQLRLLDLRDDQLERLGVQRAQLVATSPEHYPCTRQRAERLAVLQPGGQPTDGLLWHSRVAEITQQPSQLRGDLLEGPTAEVAVLYGQPGDRLLAPHGPTVDLLDGEGQWPVLVDQVAEQLLALVM